MVDLADQLSDVLIDCLILFLFSLVLLHGGGETADWRNSSVYNNNSKTTFNTNREKLCAVS